MDNLLRKIVIALAAVVMLLGLWGCPEQQGPAEEAGEQIDESVEEGGEQLEDLGEKGQQ